ncbi:MULTISPECIES: autotransporter assembly complex protein TamA [Marinobacter]|jgi:translocation and assembly module TamA|uniref:autotransporter assembly complex protein TamA n=1 Tax=Marinobacter TaxID=2742 RepID=UPI0012588022|nr:MULTISPECIES: autotransporter assembly complex family protein [Marinobacter]MCZ4286047.1 autotransporter assembly complex protein TamA [Marinobacter salarius]MDC8456039.1 outer membrane protein assembly factor [Marinobacter sp. DS40M6]VVT05715.1 Autotransporter secretion outer membrane protein TamA [Marinobacter salarius]VXC10455.1 Autotransporter secretion outer membrane protein TamA [Marinobacter salarius]
MMLATPGLTWAQQVEVNVEGDYPQLQDNAEAFLGEVEGRSAGSLRRYASTAEAQVEEALRALGYYSPMIQWEVVEQPGDDEIPARLVLTVQPGEPIRVRSRQVSIEGPASRDSDFVGTLPEKPSEGDVLNHGQYSTLRQTIQNRATRLGYFDGEFTTRRLEVNPEQHTADISLVFRSGVRYRLGEVSFKEGHGFEEQLLEQFVRFEPGEIYHADKVARLSGDLSNSGYFSGVDIDASPGKAEDGVIPVSVDLTTRPPRSVAAGVGFSTDVGPRFSGNWREHWINPMGHRRGAQTELSAPRQNVGAWYELPLDPPMTDSIRLSAGYQREDIEDVESELLTLGQQWKHQLDNGWLQVASIRWEGERFRIGDDDPEQSSLLLPGLGYSKLQADSPLDPSRGYRIQFDVTGSHRAVISDVDILHANVLVKGLYTLADNHRFLSRFQFGGVATNRFSDVPPSLRFFAGGDQTVRGYGYETLSPRNSEDVAIGGRYLMVGSVEYQYEFTENWRVAAFVDEGNAMDDLSDPLATGAGVGIRWISPVGPLRLDVAKGLDPEFGGEWRVHFSMGPEL